MRANFIGPDMEDVGDIAVVGVGTSEDSAGDVGVDIEVCDGVAT